MTLLPQPMKTLFEVDFSSPLKIAQAGGTVYGSPLYQDGIVLGGFSDYVVFEMANTQLSAPKLSYVLAFTPAFEADDGEGYYILDNNPTSARYALIKSTGNALQLYLGNTFIALISYDSYGDYWKTYERNVLVVSGEDGDTSVWLNGNLILNQDSTSWTPAFPTQLVVGARYDGGTKFKGTIHSVSYHNRLLTGEEAQALYDNSLFNFENKADLWLDMKSQTSDGTNTITKDKSGRGHDFKLGDGTTSSTFPSFSAPGFDFDGSSDYMLNDSASGIFNNDEQSIVVCFKPDFRADDGVTHYLFNSTSGSQYYLGKGSASNLALLLGSTLIASVVAGSYGAYWRLDGLNIVAIAAESGNTNMWLNGVLILSADNTAWSPKDPTEIYIGSNNATTERFDGSIYHFSTYPFKLSPIQVDQLTNQLMGEYH